MQTAMPRIWTLVFDFISYDGNSNAKCVSQIVLIIIIIMIIIIIWERCGTWSCRWYHLYLVCLERSSRAWKKDWRKWKSEVYSRSSKPQLGGGEMVKALDCGIVVREFELQSHYYVLFRTNTLGKDMNPLILPSMG